MGTESTLGRVEGPGEKEGSRFMVELEELRAGQFLKKYENYWVARDGCEGTQGYLVKG